MHNKIKKIALAFFGSLLFYSSNVKSQPFLKKLNELPQGLSFIQKARIINAFFDTATFFNRSMYKQWKRWEWFMNHHLNSKGDIENFYQKNMQAIEASNRFAQTQGLQNVNVNSGSWASVGHAGVTAGNNFSYQGRVNCIAFDPVNAGIVYAGAACGGIWKSADFGNSWVSISDYLPTLSVASIAVNPSNSNIIYALSGEGINWNFYYHKGIGILKSTDGGNSWKTTGLSNSLSDMRGGYKLLIDPANNNTVIAAMSNGLFRSLNAGTTWDIIPTINSNINDIEFKPGDPNTLYYTNIGSSILKRLNLTTLTTNYLPVNFTQPPTRIEIGVTPANPDAVYLLAGPSYSVPAGCSTGSSSMYNGLYYSPDNGATFTLKNNNVDIFGVCKDQSDYDIVIHVSPINENDVIIGGIRLYRSLDGGSTVSLVNDPTNSVHHDCHALERNPNNFNLYIGNDGGVHRSTTGGASWSTASDGLVINEYYRISGIQSNSSLLLGGTQDNGLFIRNNNSNIFYTPQILLDFMDNIIDFTDANIMYACNQDGGLHKSTNGGLNFSPINIPGGGGNWITPIVQLPNSAGHNTIFYGSKNGVLRTVDGGANWVNIGGLSNTDCNGIGTDGTNFRIYNTSNNLIQACDNPTAASPVWTSLTAPTPSRITSVAVNPANKNDVWLTYGGYTANKKVYRSTNGGASWVNFSLSLPNIPVYSIAFATNINNPSGAVYIGTELGVFYKNDNMSDWEPFYNGLPMVPVTDLQVNYSGNIIYAATYGRGIWWSSLYSSCTDNLLLTDIVKGSQAFQASIGIQSLQTVQGSTGNDLRLKAGQIIRLNPGFSVLAGGRLHAGIGPCYGLLPKVKEANKPSQKNYRKK